MKKKNQIEPDTHDNKPIEKVILTNVNGTLTFHCWNSGQMKYETLLQTFAGTNADRIYRACRTKALRFSV